MITLKTGILGSGKSLSAVQELAKQIDKWSTEKGQAKRLPVFVHGVRGLALEHAALPVFPAGGKPGDPVELDRMGRPAMGTTLSVDWASVPDQCLVIIDECQDIFPPRGSGSKVPESVAWLQRSRHHAVDLVLITQHPRLIDSTVRAFIGKHQHYRRMFGGARAVVYEWDGVSDGLQYKTATKTFWPYPKSAFKWYKSAEEHNKQSFKLPVWLVVPVMAIVLGVFSVPKVWATFHGIATGKGLSELSASAPVPSPAASTVHQVSHPVGSSPAQVGGPVSGVPVQHQTVEAVAQAASDGDGEAAQPRPVVVSGCIAMQDKCKCYGQNGMLSEAEPQQCVDTIGTAGKVLPLDVALVRNAQETSPHEREITGVPMAEIRRDTHREARAYGQPIGRKSQSWQAPLLRDIERM